MDFLSKKERSKRMSLIRGKWTKQERMFHSYLKAYKIRHKMHPKIPGSPDILLKDRFIGIYLHGCFWHGCKRCYKPPTSNKKFWKDKLVRNIKRDRKKISDLKKEGYSALVIWEHDLPLSKFGDSFNKIMNKKELRLN